jgi:hypothetical protein
MRKDAEWRKHQTRYAGACIDCFQLTGRNRHTLLMIQVSHATNLAMYRSLPYHPADERRSPILKCAPGSKRWASPP